MLLQLLTSEFLRIPDSGTDIKAAEERLAAIPVANSFGGLEALFELSHTIYDSETLYSRRVSLKSVEKLMYDAKHYVTNTIEEDDFV